MAGLMAQRPREAAVIERRGRPGFEAFVNAAPGDGERAAGEGTASQRLLREMDEYYDCLAAMEEEAGAARR